MQLQVNGELTFNEDATEVVALSPRDAVLDMTLRDGKAVQHVEMRHGADGKLVRKLWVDGEERPWDARWFAALLVDLDRHSGFAADLRFPSLYRKGGAAGVLDAVERMSGDYGRSRYLRKLIEADPLGQPTIARILAIPLSSDYERSRVLLAIASKSSLRDEATRSAFVAATAQMTSDYERGRVLRAVLSRGDLSPALARAALGSAATMSSDYEKSRVLLALANGPLGPDSVVIYLEAVRSMTSDFERARALLGLVHNDRVGGEKMGDVVHAARGLQSDFEASRVLLAVAARPGLTSAVRAEIEAAAHGLRSDFEARRVLAALGRSGG